MVMLFFKFWNVLDMIYFCESWDRPSHTSMCAKKTNIHGRQNKLHPAASSDNSACYLRWWNIHLSIKPNLLIETLSLIDISSDWFPAMLFVWMSYGNSSQCEAEICISTLVPCDRTNMHPLDAAICIQVTENSIVIFGSRSCQGEEGFA